MGWNLATSSCWLCTWSSAGTAWPGPATGSACMLLLCGDSAGPLQRRQSACWPAAGTITPSGCSALRTHWSDQTLSSLCQTAAGSQCRCTHSTATPARLARSLARSLAQSHCGHKHCILSCYSSSASPIEGKSASEWYDGGTFLLKGFMMTGVSLACLSCARSGLVRRSPELLLVAQAPSALRLLLCVGLGQHTQPCVRPAAAVCSAAWTVQLCKQ